MKIGDFKTTIQGPSGTYLFTSEKMGPYWAINLTHKDGSEILLNDYMVKSLNGALDIQRSVIFAIDMNDIPRIISKCPICGHIERNASTDDHCLGCKKDVTLRRFVL